MIVVSRSNNCLLQIIVLLIGQMGGTFLTASFVQSGRRCHYHWDIWDSVYIIWVDYHLSWGSPRQPRTSLENAMNMKTAGSLYQSLSLLSLSFCFGSVSSYPSTPVDPISHLSFSFALSSVSLSFYITIERESSHRLLFTSPIVKTSKITDRLKIRKHLLSLKKERVFFFFSDVLRTWHALHFNCE